MRYSKPVGKTKEKASITTVPGRQVLVYFLIEFFFLEGGTNFRHLQ
jgi:hypothetical protein